MPELMAKAEDRTPYTVVALQECDRMNSLTNEMKISLKELDLGLKVLCFHDFHLNFYEFHHLNAPVTSFTEIFADL